MNDPNEHGGHPSPPNLPNVAGTADVIQQNNPPTSARLSSQEATERELDKRAFPQHLRVISLENERRTLGSIIDECTVVLVYRADIQVERMVAEIVWVEERLKPGIPFVVIVPGLPTGVELAAIQSERARLFRDTGGTVAQSLSPNAPRTAFLVEPDSWQMTVVGASDQVFAIGREVRDSDDRGSDHLIDLGDVFR